MFLLSFARPSLEFRFRLKCSSSFANIISFSVGFAVSSGDLTEHSEFLLLLFQEFLQGSYAIQRKLLEGYVKEMAKLNYKYKLLLNYCDERKSATITPEYYGVLNVENKLSWSPTDYEVARILMSITIPSRDEEIAYTDLAEKLDQLTRQRKCHIYRSLKVILRKPQKNISGLAFR
jgi:hypothetical protein